MWLYLVSLVGLWTLLRFFRERQVVSHLQDKYVFITGCDSGFGNLLARQLDRRGMRVLAACLTEKGAEELRNKTSDRQNSISVKRFHDCGLWGLVNNAGISVPLFLGLWGLVNNAGISVPSGPSQWMNKQNFASILDVNLLGMIEVTLSMLPLVRKARGRVVNVSSIVGLVSFGGGGYCISKYGVEAFSDSLSSARLSSNTQMLWDQTSSEIREIYGEKYLASYLKMVNELDKRCNKDLSLVTDCMEHALTACHPRTRYSAGWDAKLFFIPLSYLPTFLVDAVFYWTSMKPEKAL
ncbi:retinol dehydrogenase 16-like [Mus caroli]|uniref:Retinol dehydrogenase 16-like n=1 Tax=Mus caroli TaxID=10089 RepID=A0A6P5QFM5_MUSCR|nr:retinol dehydrogenase 16-like [Mus caroli]